MMGLATLLSILFTTGGLAISFQSNIPAGATIIIFAGTTFLAVTAGASLIKRKR